MKVCKCTKPKISSQIPEEIILAILSDYKKEPPEQIIRPIINKLIREVLRKGIVIFSPPLQKSPTADTTYLHFIPVFA